MLIFKKTKLYNKYFIKDFIDFVLDNTHLTYKYVLVNALLERKDVSKENPKIDTGVTATSQEDAEQSGNKIEKIIFKIKLIYFCLNYNNYNIYTHDRN